MTRADRSFLLLAFMALLVLLTCAVLGIWWSWAEYYHWGGM